MRQQDLHRGGQGQRGGINEEIDSMIKSGMEGAVGTGDDELTRALGV